MIIDYLYGAKFVAVGAVKMLRRMLPFALAGRGA